MNYLVLLMIGTSDTAFLRINNIAFWLLVLSLLFAVLSTIIDEGLGTGWTVYLLLSSLQSHSGISVDMAIFALHFSGFSSIFGSINLMVTIMNMRANGMDYSKLNLFTWSVLITAVLILISILVLAAGLTMLLADRNFNTSFFVVAGGGDLILYQHIFYKKILDLILIISILYIIYKNITQEENLYNILYNNSLFDINLFYSEYKRLLLNNKLLSLDFIIWFIGFMEGDGSFTIGKKNLEIVITQKEKEVLEKIVKELNIGSVTLQSKKLNYYRWISRKDREIYLLCLLFNGNLVLLKRLIKFNLFLNRFNERLLKNKQLIINLKYYCKLLSINNSWISGFTDAEGCFSISILNSNTNAYRLRYLIAQKWEFNKYVLEEINKEFSKYNNNILIGKVNQHSIENNYELRINGLKNCKFLINYFDKYLLLSKKFISYNKWKDVMYMIEKGDHLDLIKRIKIKKLCKKINI